ncbi:MAG: hypothetical protein AB7F64_01340, partial [Gammaproteobacteria bacterium]
MARQDEAAQERVLRGVKDLQRTGDTYLSRVQEGVIKQSDAVLAGGKQIIDSIKHVGDVTESVLHGGPLPETQSERKD